MSRAITRHFIGPLTPAQQERRRRARYSWNDISEVMDGRGASFLDAAKAVKWQRDHQFTPRCLLQCSF